MIELIRTNDPVLISWLVAHLKAENIGYAVLDHHTSNLEGSIGAIPRRIMVIGEDEDAARRILDARPNPRSDTEEYELRRGGSLLRPAPKGA